MASKTYNYLVTIDKNGTPKKFALLRVECPGGWVGLGLTGLYESRLIEEPSFNNDMGDPWGGIVNSAQLTLRFNDPAGEFTPYLDNSDLRLVDISLHEYEYGTTTNPSSRFAGVIKTISAECAVDGIVVITLGCESFKAGLLDTFVPRIAYTNDNQWETDDQYKVADEFGARFAAIVSGTREHVPCVQVRANPTVPSYQYVIAHDIASEEICQQYDAVQVPDGTWIGLGCETSVNNIYRLSSDDSKLRVVDLGINNGSLTISRETKNYEDASGYKYLVATADKNLRARLYADIETCELDINGLIAGSATVPAAWRFTGDLVSDDNSAQPYEMVTRRTGSMGRNHDFQFTKATNDEGEHDSQTATANKIVFVEITGCQTPPCKPNFETGWNGSANAAIAIYKNVPFFTDETHRAYQYDYNPGGGATVFATTSVYIEAVVRMNTEQTLSNGLKIPPRINGCLFAQPYVVDAGHGGIYFYVTETGLQASVAFIDYVGPPFDARKFGYVSGDFTFEGGRWYTIGFEIDRTTSNAILRLYVDNNVIAESVVASVPTSAWTVSNQVNSPAAIPWRLFNDNAYNVGHTGFQGVVDRVQLYNNTKVPTVQFLGGMTGQSISAFKLESGYDVAVSDGVSADLNGTGRNALGFTANDYLIMLWFRSPAVGTLQTIVQYGTFSSDGWKITINGSGNIAFYYNNATARVTSGPGYDDDKWHQIWVKINRSSNNITLRVDRTETTSGAITVGSVSAGAILQCGDYTASPGFAGYIDELVIVKGTAAQLKDELYRTTQYYTAKGNPAMTLARVLGSMPWGLGSKTAGKYQIIDYDPTGAYGTGTKYPLLTNSFGTTAATLDSYDLSLNGAFFNEQKAADVIDEICSIYGITVWFDGVKWMCGLVWSSSTIHLMGWKDAARQNVDRITYSRASADNVPQSVIVRFGRVTDMERTANKAYLFETEKKAIANGKAEEKRYLDFNLIRKPDVADRVCAYYAGWWTGDRSIEADVQKTKFQDIAVGDMVQLEATPIGVGSAYTNDDFRVFSIARSPDFGMKVKLYEDMKATAIDGYTPGVYTTVVDQDLQADYRFTPPPPPTDFYCTSVSYWSFGAICTFSFTAPIGQIVEEALSHVVLEWQERPNGSSDTGADAFFWNTVIIHVRPGQIYHWTTRDFIPTHTYVIKIYSVTYYGQVSPRGTVIEAGLTTMANQAYGIPGAYELKITPPYDATVTNGAYMWEQSVAGGGAGHYKITPSPAFDGSNVGPYVNFFPVAVDIATAGQEPVIILDNAWYSWKASAPGVYEFSTSGTGNKDVTFGRAPDFGATAYAIVKPA